MTMKYPFTLLALLLPLVLPTSTLAGPRDSNHVVNPGFEDNADGKAKGWSNYGEGYELVREGRDGGWCIRWRSDTGRQTIGAAQEVVFDPPVQHPILISGWSKAAGVEGGEYCVYLDVHYADGTPLWGQKAIFQRGTHEWSRAESIITPSKPVARSQTFVLFRNAKGTAWFDDIRVSLAPERFTRTTALGGFAGAGHIEALASVSLPSTWQTQVRHGERVVFTQQGEGPTQRISWNGRDAEGQAVPPGKYTIRFTATDRLLGETITWNQEVDTTAAPSGRNYALWTESSMRRVMPVDLPETNDPPAALALSAAHNESESGQIVIMPPSGVALKNVRVTIPDLTGPNGARIASDNVRWHQVGYVWGYKNNDAPLDLAKGARLSWSINTGGPDWPALHGDGALLYPLLDGPAGSIRLANLRDGLEDYEYLWALGQKRGDPWSARKDCELVTTSLTAFTRDPAVLLATRERVARELMKPLELSEK